jgi:hypothetical protein
MAGGRELAHVGANLGDHGLNARPHQAPAPPSAAQQCRERAKAQSQCGRRRLQRCPPTAQSSAYADRAEPMMLPDTAGENLYQLSPRAAETLMAKHGELFGIRLACDHGLQHAPMMSVFASSRTAWMRCTCRTISRVNCFRVDRARHRPRLAARHPAGRRRELASFAAYMFEKKVANPPRLRPWRHPRRGGARIGQQCRRANLVHPDANARHPIEPDPWR